MSLVPEIWRRFFEQVVPSPPAEPRGSLLHQTGEMRMENGKWVPFTAEQSFEATRVGFCWHARAKLLPLVTVVVEDAYEDGHGRLEAKLFGALRVMSAAPGIDLDRGELLRYVAELAWNPMAIVHNPDLRFGTSPAGLPRVWAHDEATYVDFVFGDDGLVREIRADNRVRGTLGAQPWGARYLSYGELGGVRIPIDAEVWWDGPGERQVYWRGTITSFEWG